MTNNVDTIYQHGTHDNSQKELMKLIKNVIESEKQITDTISSINSQTVNFTDEDNIQLPSDSNLLVTQQIGAEQQKKTKKLVVSE